ncbi:MAG: hypothetical protein JOZ31_26080 [Verrucomicrobia bacterium]|nr:hypothetical protein [Verrucomicrobiota bacterium]MBV8485581.1 hypothetical protein [Verrucomicrobiota bacterium]
MNAKTLNDIRISLIYSFGSALLQLIAPQQKLKTFLDQKTETAMSIFEDWFRLIDPALPGPGMKVDSTIYLSLWSGQRGEKEHVKCIGIRGELAPDHVPILGIYDDVLILMIGDVCTEWKGSTNPGKLYIDHPTNPKGCAQLIEGVHMFKPGIHGGQFPAFVQAEDFPVNRLNEKGQTISHEVGQFGIHLHSGGPGEDVNQYSAGCQIVWSPEGYFGATWHRFFDPASKAMQDNNQSILPYMLVDATNLLPSQALRMEQ